MVEAAVVAAAVRPSVSGAWAAVSAPTLEAAGASSVDDAGAAVVDKGVSAGAGSAVDWGTTACAETAACDVSGGEAVVVDAGCAGSLGSAVGVTAASVVCVGVSVCTAAAERAPPLCDDAAAAALSWGASLLVSRLVFVVVAAAGWVLTMTKLGEGAAVAVPCEAATEAAATTPVLELALAAVVAVWGTTWIPKDPCAVEEGVEDRATAANVVVVAHALASVEFAPPVHTAWHSVGWPGSCTSMPILLVKKTSVSRQTRFITKDDGSPGWQHAGTHACRLQQKQTRQTRSCHI
jgi:hypothetical protein